ncbi:MAG: alkaline phosphatase family protein [Candidatus Sulfotelmatobacter sp.]|jgi:phospholipase C
MISKGIRSMAAVVCGACMMIGPFVEAWGAEKPKELVSVTNPAESYPTQTPIKHLVVIFGENISFDHYFATYPNATNPASEPQWTPKANTPTVNNLLSGGLLTENPNSVQPFRLDRTQSVTCDQNHSYTPEQQAFDMGAMDKFVQYTGTGGSTCDYGYGTGLVMGYYDGNTVTAMWNYAQTYAMSDNSFNSQFGPSAPGAINLISGNTANVQYVSGGSTVGVIAGGGTSGALLGDGRPAGDDCNPTGKTYVSFPTGTNNIGDELNNASYTWGWCQGGFGPTSYNGQTAVCAAASTGLAGTTADYVAHHEPFMFYPETANPHHLAPTSTIGTSDQANHQYDLSEFTSALNADLLPAVSYVKAKAVYDAHPGYSDPLDEQTFVVNTINAIQANKYWKDTAIIIAYDDSDGWYDHVMDPLVNQSQSSIDDALTGPGLCGGNTAATTQGRCGYGPRTPLLVISPYSKQNYVDHVITDQSSILQFIEYNWSLPAMGNGSNDAKAGSLLGLFEFTGKKAPKLVLDPTTGEIVP